MSDARSSGTLTFVIINPVSGPARRGTADERVRLATDALDSVGLRAEILLTESAGHAYELARHAVGAGAELVIAWGGDGTINEVGRAVAFSNTAMGIVPAGSGNGLARELGIPFAPAESSLRTRSASPSGKSTRRKLKARTLKAGCSSTWPASASTRTWQRG